MGNGRVTGVWDWGRGNGKGSIESGSCYNTGDNVGVGVSCVAVGEKKSGTRRELVTILDITLQIALH